MPSSPFCPCGTETETGGCHTWTGGCEPAGEAAPSSSSVTHLLPLGAARPQDATGPRVPFQATLALLPFFSFGACGHGRGTWMLRVLTPLGTATLLRPSVTSRRHPQPLLRSGPLRLLWGARTPSRPAVRCHGRGGDGDGIHQPRDTLCRRRGDTSFEPCQPARRHRAQRQLTPSFPEGWRLSSAPLPKSPDACDCPGRDREIQPDGRGGVPPGLWPPKAHLGIVLLLLALVLGRPRVPSELQVSDHTLQDTGAGRHGVLLPCHHPASCPQSRGGHRGCGTLTPAPAPRCGLRSMGKSPLQAAAPGGHGWAPGSWTARLLRGAFWMYSSLPHRRSTPHPSQLAALPLPTPGMTASPAPPPSDFVFLRLIPTSFPFIWVLEASCAFRPFIHTTNPSLRTSPPEKPPELSHPCRQRGSIPIQTQEGAWAKPRSPLLGRDVGMLPAQQGRNPPTRGVLGGEVGEEQCLVSGRDT